MYKNGCSPLLVIELSPLNELYKGKACALNNTYTFCDILTILGIHTYQVETMCRVQE